MSAEAPTKRYAWPVFLVVSLFLVIRFLWAVLAPGGEWPLSPAHYLAMAVDLGLLIGVFGLRSEALSVMPPDDGRRTTVGFLFVLGAISGAGLMLIRLTSDAAWWTGHL